MLTEDGLALLLSRMEAKAIQSSQNRELYLSEKRKREDAETKLRQAHYALANKNQDLGNAEKKVDEWLMFSEHLTRLIPKRRHKEIGPLPKPLETEIPF